MSTVVESLDELAAQFEDMAKRCEHASLWEQEDKLYRASLTGESRAWKQAAYVLKRTTLRRDME